MLDLAWIGLFLPLMGFLVLLLFSNIIGRKTAGLIACSTILIAFLCFSTILMNYTYNDLNPQTLVLYNWVPVESINADFSIHIDPLSLLMTLIITGVGFLIHVYSIGYMDHEEDIVRYFACMNLFVFFMLLLVLAANVLLLFVGWEGVGLASYLLIGYYYQRPAAAQAAIKAFVVNRIGDLGLLLGLLLTFQIFGTGNIEEISKRASTEFPIGAPLVGVLTLLYFVGATGKSAQIPLHTWLPDAMEGPTPVSALIHAATMVTAGVYLVVRLHDVFMLTPTTLHIVGAIGGVTALFAALCAIGQTDLKRVLAYSTVSQLGFMFLACGVGAFYAAMFHLTMHAFMKALLFLSAGNVIHMLHGETDMRKMGGLAKKFPITNWLFLIGVLAMSGIPPLSAFFSKDLILEQEHLAGFDALFYVGLIASILTAFYLTRAYFLTFLGQPRTAENNKSIQEAPQIMLWPVGMLALLSILGGFLGFGFGKTALLEGFLAEIGITLFEPIHALLSTETIMALVGALLGIFSAAYIYSRYTDQSPIQFLRKAFYIDEIYDFVFVKPLEALARFIDNFLEPKVFEGSMNGVVDIAQGSAQKLQLMQSGQIRSYVAWMVVGLIMMIAFFIF
jgi:NADH-quinone oxidoreductase subunit L